MSTTNGMYNVCYKDADGDMKQLIDQIMECNDELTLNEYMELKNQLINISESALYVPNNIKAVLHHMEKRLTRNKLHPLIRYHFHGL